MAKLAKLREWWENAKLSDLDRLKIRVERMEEDTRALEIDTRINQLDSDVEDLSNDFKKVEDVVDDMEKAGLEDRVNDLETDYRAINRKIEWLAKKLYIEDEMQKEFGR